MVNKIVHSNVRDNDWASISNEFAGETIMAERSFHIKLVQYFVGNEMI